MLSFPFHLLSKSNKTHNGGTGFFSLLCVSVCVSFSGRVSFACLFLGISFQSCSCAPSQFLVRWVFFLFIFTYSQKTNQLSLCYFIDVAFFHFILFRLNTATEFLSDYYEHIVDLERVLAVDWFAGRNEWLRWRLQYYEIVTIFIMLSTSRIFSLFPSIFFLSIKCTDSKKKCFLSVMRTKNHPNKRVCPIQKHEIICQILTVFC